MGTNICYLLLLITIPMGQDKVVVHHEAKTIVFEEKNHLLIWSIEGCLD
jgi:hypothetical protein